MNNIYDIIIVGAGPSGLTAALYGRRANKKILVLEANSYGGQILEAKSVENYPGIPLTSGMDYADTLYNQVINLGASYSRENVLSIKDGEIKKVVTNKNTYETKTIILATGSKKRKLSIDDSDKYLGLGLSYCATCDGAFFKNLVVAVIGGGETAADDAIYLSNIASKVYLIHYKDSFKASVTKMDKIKSLDNVEIITNANTTKINGSDTITSITINKDNKEEELEVSGVFIAVGQVPRNDEFSDLINLSESGFIITDEDCNTNVPGIFASGDCRIKKIRQLTTACSDGTIAAMSAITYIAKLTK